MLSDRLLERRLLPKGRLGGPLAWVIAIMVFLACLATAGAAALGGAAATLGDNLEGQVTIQIVEANALARAQSVLGGMAGVSKVEVIGEERLRELIAPWLGAGADADVPLPALIDVELDIQGRAQLSAIAEAVKQAVPTARIDDHARWLEPLAGLLSALGWVAFGLVLLTGIATAAAVMLATRAALDGERSAIDILHLLGATDVQIARVFQRRIAYDALLGGVLGLIVAIMIILLIGWQLGKVGAGLFTGAALGWFGWLLIGLLPIFATLLTIYAARTTVLRNLGRIL
jgi:cell division transport system permease protein